eukprot:COSAG02_NODE_33329_length_501_cov_8.776119_1_plen_38_part_01
MILHNVLNVYVLISAEVMNWNSVVLRFATAARLTKSTS